MKLFDTTLPQNYSKALFEEQCLDIAEEHTDKMFDVMFTGSANLLKAVRSQDKAAVFKVNNLNGSMVAAAICRYFKNEEDETKPGNWSLVWTFYESDIPEDAIVIDLGNTQCHAYFIATAGKKYGICFKDAGCLVNTLGYTIIQLKKWLDENAKEGSDVMVEQDGIFQARVAVNKNGVKEFALEPAGEIKNLIKGDDEIEEK